MTLGPLALALALSLSPPAAARFALLADGHALATRDGRLTVADRLVRVCWRESRCVPPDGHLTAAEAAARSHRVGVHVRDAASSRRVWRKMVRRGELDPACQPYEPGMWATRGPWGLMAALHARYLPECYAPHWLDVPLVSAAVAARKYLERCEPLPWAERPRWCTKRMRH